MRRRPYPVGIWNKSADAGNKKKVNKYTISLDCDTCQK